MMKWSAVEPQQQERRFIWARLIRNDEGMIMACVPEAVIIISTGSN
jgi:hypothetical protein